MVTCYGIHSEKGGFLIWYTDLNEFGIIGFATKEIAEEWFKKMRDVGGLNGNWGIKEVELLAPFENFDWLEKLLKDIAK